MSAKEIITLFRYDVITLVLSAGLGVVFLLRRFLPGQKRRELNALLSALYACLPSGREDVLRRLKRALYLLFLRGKDHYAADTVRKVLQEHSSLSQEEIEAAVAAVRAVNSDKSSSKRKK